MTGAEVLGALSALTGRPRRDGIRAVLYKTRHRPRELREQFVLFDGMSRWDDLSLFVRSYALVASAHKACELADPDLCATLLPRIEAALEQARGLPGRNGVRSDGRHLRFSLLHVGLNLSLLCNAGSLAAFARAALDEVAAIDPRRVSSRFFNSTSNIVKVVGIALLALPDELEAQAAQISRLVYLGVRTMDSQVPLWLNRRFVFPDRLDRIEVPISFQEFIETARRVDIIIAAAAETDPATRTQRIRAIGHACVAQRTPLQKAAMLAAVDRLLGIRPDD